MMNKTIAFMLGFIMMVLPSASAGIIYDEETREVSTIAGVWKKQWEASPDLNWTAPPVQFEGQNMYFGQSGVGTDYPRSMAVSDDGMFGAINYGQSGPGSEFNKYQLQSSGSVGDEEGRKPLAMSDDGRYIMVGEMSGAVQPYVYFFSTDTGPVWNLAVGGAVKDIDLTNDGEYGVSCGQNTMGASYHTLYMFSRENNSVVWDYDFDSGYCFAAAISDDGRYIVAGELDGATSELIVYDHQQQSIIWQKDMPSHVYDVAISGDGDFFVVGLGSGIVGNEFLKFTTTSSTEDWGYKASATVHHAQVSYDQTAITMMDFGGYVYYFTPSSGTPVWTDTSTTNRGQEIGISDDGNVIVAVRQTNGLAVYGPTSATPLMQNSMDGASSGPTGSVDVSGNGKHIVVFDSQDRMYIWSDGGNGWSSSDSAPIWSESGEANDVVISSGGYYGYSDDNDVTLNFGKIPIYSNTYSHDTPIYDEMWGFEDYTADYEAIGDLEGLWLLDESKGTTTKDHSGNGNDGTITGASWGSGKLGSGLYMDQTTGYVSVPNAPQLNPSTGVTISQWINHDGGGGPSQSMVTKMDQYTTEVWNSNDCGGWFWINTVAKNTKSSDGSCTENIWHHVVLSYDVATCTASYYLDGTLKNANTYASPCLLGDTPDGTYPNLELGRWSGTSQVVNGNMDEVVIYSEALSAAEVASLYAISHDRIEAGLMGHWRMEEETGTTVADSSGNGNTGSLNGGGTLAEEGAMGSGMKTDSGGCCAYLSVPDSDSLDTSQAFTVALWAKARDEASGLVTGNKDHMIAKYHTGGNERSWRVTLGNDYGGQVMMEVSGDGTTSTMIRCKGQDIGLDVTEWHHYVFGVDLSKGGWDEASCIGPYVDGVNIFDDETAVTSATSSVSGSATSLYTGTAAVGTIYNGNAAPWEGQLDELQLWSRGLNEEEIETLYNFQYHGDPVKIDSAQNGRYIVSRTQSGAVGGGIAFFDTFTTPLATPDWTATVGAGAYMDMSDNANPMIITGNNDGTVRVFNSTGVEQFNFVAPWDITGVGIEDDNSYAYAGSKDHHIYGWDLTKMDSYMNARHGDPLGYWQFSEGTGTTIADSSGNGYDLTAVNDAWVSGKYGNALDFDGLTQKATTSATAFDNIMQRPNTVSMWVYVEDNGENDNNWLVSKDIWKLRLCPDIGCTGVASSSSHIIFNGVGTYRSLDSVITHDQWVHLAMTYQGHGTYGATPTFYVNGVEVEGAWETGSAPSCCNQMADDSSHPLVVGNHEGSAHTHDGAIDHLMIFPEVLNAEAVNLLYSSATAFQFTYAEWDNWVGGEVVALTSDNGKVAVVTTGKELIVYNSAGVEQWREPTEDIPSSVEFANGRVSYTLAALREGFTHDDNFAGIEEDTDLSYYFKYGRPAGLYTMDECDGEILYDSSGHGLRSEDTFIVAGGQSGGSNNGKPAWVGGVDGCALHFHSEGNAKGNYVQWEERYRGPQIAGDSYTISYWWNQATDGTTIDSAYEAGDKPNQNSWGISGRHGTAYNPNVYTQSNFNNVNFFCYNSNEYIEKGPDYPEDYIKRSPEGWIMHTCVRDLTTGEVSLYINGELIHTQSDDSTPMFRQNVYTDPDHWTIGRNQAGYYGTGNVDEVVFYKQALSAADIFDMYKRTVSTPFDMNPVGYWPLDLWVQEGDGYAVTGNVEDKSGNANNGWTYSNPTSTQDYAQINYPSFTSGAVGTSPPAGYTENNPAVCNWAIDNTHYKLSNKALGVDCINQQPSGASTSLDHTSPITVPSNTEYTLSGWVYVDLLGMDLDGAGGNGYVTYLSMYDNVGIGPTDFSGCNLGTTTVGEKVIENPSDWEQWHYLSCTGNTGGATTLNIGMRVQDFRCDAICVWFDDLQLKVGPRLTKGMVGNALIFDGIGDHIKLNNQVVESTAVTVSAWVRPDSAPTNVNRVVGSELANDGFILYFDASGHARFLVGDGTTTGDVVGTTVIQSGGWYHLVGTYDGTTTSIYVNGVLEGTDGTSPATITYPAGGNTYIGGDESGGVGPERLFKGAIDEVAIFDRALSSDEIKTLAYKSQSRLDAGLLAFYPAHEEQDHSSWDSYDNQLGLYPMTLVGGASFDDGKIGDGLTFDGVNDYANLGALGPSGATPRTLSFWIKLDECPGAVPATCPSAVNKFFMSFGEAVGGKFFAPRIVSATNALGIMIHNAGDYEDIQCSDVGYEELEDKWNHITYTYDGDTTITIYVNGMFDCSATTGIPLDTSSGFDAYIGARNDGGWSLGTVADIDEVGIWSRALSPGEIIELYNSRTHEAFHEDGFVTYSSTGERIVDTTGGNSQFTGIAVADDGTTVMLYDSDLESDTTAEEYWVYGNTLGTAASFDKNGDMINLGNVATFTGATELSIGTWLYRTGYNQHLTALVSKDGSFEAFISSGNFGSKPYLSLSICGGAGASVEFPTVSVPVDTWTHVGFTFEGNGGSGSDTRKVYIDGVLADTQTTGTKSVVCSTGDDLSIGARSNGIYTLPGQMSDLRLYTELLDAGEMAQLASQNPFITGNYATTSTTLTGWWKLNEDFTEGATAVDSSASGNDGTPVGAETYYNHMQSRYAVFDGTDDYIALGQPLIDDANEGLTFSIWFKEESFTQQTGIFSRRYAEDGLAVWNACDQWTFRLELDTVLNAIYTTGNCDGEWHNFIGTWDGTTMRTYVDGNYQDKTTPGCSPCAFTNTGHTFNIGRDLYSTNYFDGFITDVRFYDTAISEADITAIAGTNPATTGRYAETFSTPVGWWKLNGYADDWSYNHNDGSEQGGITYQHGGGMDYGLFTKTAKINENVIGFGRDGRTLMFGVDATFHYLDSLGNGWQQSDSSPSWLITEQKDITAVHADGSTTSWGTADGNTVFKSPGLHPLSANLITFWNLGSIQARPVYSITADRISNNGTWWAGEMAVGLDGSLYFESIYDTDSGQQGYIFYKYNVTGSKVWEVKTDTYGWFKKSVFSSDSRSSMDVATNGSVLVALDNGFAYIGADGTPTFLGSDYPNFPTVVGPGQCMFLDDTGEVAFASRASGSVNEYFVYNIETKTLKWQFNSEVTAFQLDSSNNGDYIIFTNGTQMLFKSADANTLFTKAVADVKASSVANNGYVGLASSTKGWFIYDQTGKTVLSGTGEEGDRYYDIDMDIDGMWFAVAGYNVKTGNAFMEIWSLDDEEYKYPKFTRALREEKTDDDGDLRSYRVKMGEGSIRVLWAWSGSSEAGAMEYQLIKSITLIQIVEKNIKMGLSTALVLLILFVMLKFFKDFTGRVMAKW